MVNTCTLRARLVPQIQLIGKMSPTIQLRGSMHYLDGYDEYGGEYEVDPDFEGKILNTRNKVLTDDINVNPIEVARVSNPFGGRTIYIGGLING